MPNMRSVRPHSDDDHDDDVGDFEPVLGTKHRRGRDPLAVRDLTATILVERMRGVLLECSSTMHGASVLPANMGYQLCTQTLGSISTSLTEVLGQTGYAYLIPTLPAHDETTQTPMGGTRGRRQRGSSSKGSSRGRSRGLGRSISRGQTSGSPSPSGVLLPFVAPRFTSTPSHPSPPIQVWEYRHRTPTLDDIPKVDESTSTSYTGSKRGQGL